MTGAKLWLHLEGMGQTRGAGPWRQQQQGQYCVGFCESCDPPSYATAPLIPFPQSACQFPSYPFPSYTSPFFTLGPCLMIALLHPPPIFASSFFSKLSPLHSRSHLISEMLCLISVSHKVGWLCCWLEIKRVSAPECPAVTLWRAVGHKYG